MKPDFSDSQDNVRVLTQSHTVSNDTFQTGLNNNDLIVGSSGAGKTGGYVIPNILNAQGSIITSDTKRNLYRKLAPTLRAKGYRVYSIDFVRPEQSSAYNPLYYISTDADGKVREQDVMTVVNAIMPPLDRDEPFWDESAKTVAACLVSYVKEVFPPEEQTLYTMTEVFKVMQSQYGQLSKNSNSAPVIPFLEEWSVVSPDSFASRKYQMFKGVLPAEKTWSCVEAFLSASIDIFDFKESRQLFKGSSDFQFSDLGCHKCAVFLNISDTDRSFDKLVNLFYTQALQELCKEADNNPDSRLKVPVRLFLDDFATNAFIPDFDKIISVIRSREISVSVILQSLTQLETMYSHPASVTILNNCDHILYLGGNDWETAEYISRYADKPISKVLCMPLDKVWLITRGQKAELADKIRPYSYEIPEPEETSEEIFEPYYETELPF